MEKLISIPFAFTRRGVIRALMIDGAPWFVLPDMAKALQYKETRSLTQLIPPEDVRSHWMKIRGVRQPVPVANRFGLDEALQRMSCWRSEFLRNWLDNTAWPVLGLGGRSVIDRLNDYAEKHSDSRPVLDWLCTQTSGQGIKDSLSGLTPEQLSTVEEFASRGLGNGMDLGLPYPRLLERTAEQVMTFVKAVRASREVTAEAVSA